MRISDWSSDVCSSDLSVFAGSPIKRTGRDRFLRNVLIAIGNSGDASLARTAARRLDDASPLVHAMAVWALARLLPGREFEGRQLGRAHSELQSLMRSAYAAFGLTEDRNPVTQETILTRTTI